MEQELCAKSMPGCLLSEFACTMHLCWVADSLLCIDARKASSTSIYLHQAKVNRTRHTQISHTARAIPQQEALVAWQLLLSGTIQEQREGQKLLSSYGQQMHWYCHNQLKHACGRELHRRHLKDVQKLLSCPVGVLNVWFQCEETMANGCFPEMRSRELQRQCLVSGWPPTNVMLTHVQHAREGQCQPLHGKRLDHQLEFVLPLLHYHLWDAHI